MTESEEAWEEEIVPPGVTSFGSDVIVSRIITLKIIRVIRHSKHPKTQITL
jgi:hypothetical protein